jgi:ubiquinone/menaquinone biosynthesis C-methylase UbiE
MRVTAYIQPPVESLLDVGCNIGAWLRDCSALYPSARLAGVEINRSAIDTAGANVPRAEFHVSGAEHLPFPDCSFDYVTCTEVIEHLPTDLRRRAFREMRRVLRPSGRLILTVPHAGWFAWLDSNNTRLRLPRLYRRVIGRGMRDATYDEIRRPVTWHYHFTVTELMELAGEGWPTIGLERGGR